MKIHEYVEKESRRIRNIEIRINLIQHLLIDFPDLEIYESDTLGLYVVSASVLNDPHAYAYLGRSGQGENLVFTATISVVRHGITVYNRVGDIYQVATGYLGRSNTQLTYSRFEEDPLWRGRLRTWKVPERFITQIERQIEEHKKFVDTK